MKYIMIWPDGWFDTYMYRDLIDKHMIVPLTVDNISPNPVINFLRKIHYSHKINHLVKLPYKDIWNHSLYNSLSKCVDEETCIIFDTGALAHLSVIMLNKIRHLKNNIKMVLVAADSLHGSSYHMVDALPQILGFHWDFVLSYDKNDCAEFGFDYLGQTIYSKMEGIIPSREQSDLYFVGRNKAGRNQQVLDLYNQLRIHKINPNFELVDSKRNNKKSKYKNAKGIHLYSKDLPYERIISNILSTNCILEIVAPGQKVQTARYYEAVCYNKKLLTNNAAIYNLSFFNPNYMQYFEKISDIDFEWIKEKDTIDYQYNGEFSPVHLLEKIQNKLRGN